MLIYILSLEFIIKIVSNLLVKNKSDYLQNILFTAINNYLDAITFLNAKNNYLDFNLENIYLDVPSDWINSINNNLSLIKSNNINTISFNLLISGIKINYNSDNKENSYKENSSISKSSLKFNNNKNNRKYSTLISRNNILIRNFSTNSLFKDNINPN